MNNLTSRKYATASVLPAIILSFSCLFIIGCASVMPANTQQISSDELLSGAGLVDSDDLSLGDVPIIEVSDEMRAYMQESTPETSNDLWRLEQLIKSLFDEQGTDMQYDHTLTLSAQDTFSTGKGNCLSYANMVLAFAREIGLNASYQMVEIPPSWEESNSNLMLYNHHINVLIEQGLQKSVFDVNAPGDITDLEEFEVRRLPDYKAFAQFYNNLGVDQLLEDNYSQALLYFRKAILTDPEFASLWVNLGTLYRRAGHPAEAEAAYYKALELDANNYLAFSGLAALHKQTGNKRKARFFERRISKMRMQNPGYRFLLARNAIQAGDYKEAEKNLQQAIRMDLENDRLYMAMGAVKLKLDDQESADYYFAKAKELAGDDENVQRLSSKERRLKTLLSNHKTL
jgi:Flp pilus assembly protein TadD